jgi:hypothetical protein
MKLFIDDERFPPDDETEWKIVRTVPEAKLWIGEHGCPDFISFDHDLGDEVGGDAIELVHWLIETDLNADGAFIPRDFTYYVHSQNPVGVKNIQGWLDGYLSQR